jgi:hypothetical protein
MMEINVNTVAADDIGCYSVDIDLHNIFSSIPRGTYRDSASKLVADFSELHLPKSVRMLPNFA